MENESEQAFLDKNFFKTSFNKEDVTKLPSFKKWKELKEKDGNKVVKCPHCYGYEIFSVPSNYKCSMCGKMYCQKCLKPCVEDEVIHDHERGCCSKFCGLIDTMSGWSRYYKEDLEGDRCLVFQTIMTFLFGNHILYTIKYFRFFGTNKIIDNDCTHMFFKYMNLFANICYCLITFILFFEVCFTLFFPAIFIRCYYRFIVYNWVIVLDPEFTVDESPVTELTVRGRGYDLY